MSKLGPKCQYFVWSPLFSSTCLRPLGHEVTRASQFATGVLFHSSMDDITERVDVRDLVLPPPSVWGCPHRLHLPSASLARQWSSWRCVWGRYYVGILPCGPVSEGRGSCSASVCHSTCWHSWFPQWIVAPQCRPCGTGDAPDHDTPTTMLDCRQDTVVFVLLTWLLSHTLDTIWTK